jgi:hypothetical protein
VPTDSTNPTPSAAEALPVTLRRYADAIEDELVVGQPRCVGDASDCASPVMRDAAAIIERLTRERDELRAARFAYASEFPLNEDGEPDVGSIHANIRALKAQKVDVEAVMRLADEYASVPYGLDNVRAEAAREALRAAVEGRTAK